MIDTKIWMCSYIFDLDDIDVKKSHVVYKDGNCDKFVGEILSSQLGNDQFLGFSRSSKSLQNADVIIIASRDWAAIASRLVSSHSPSKISIFLYLPGDCHGFWDFAAGLGPALPDVLKHRRLTQDNVGHVGRYIGYWAEAAVRKNRISAGLGYQMRSFRETTLANATALTEILFKLADQASRDAFTNVIFGNGEQVANNYLGEVFGPQQYMDIVKLRPGDVIINGGVGSGWEIPYFVAKLRGEGAIHNFDPVWHLTGKWADSTWNAFQYMLFRHDLALSNENGTLKLATEPSGMVFGSGVADFAETFGEPDNLTEFKALTLDSMVDDGIIAGCDFVKLDLEGGELNALRGMANTLKKFRPRLAIAIYHEPEHFFEIPTYMFSILPSYRFYIRQYSSSRFETLLYCIPDEDTASVSGAEFSGLRLNAAESADRGPAVTLTAYLQDIVPRRTYVGTAAIQIDRFSGGSWDLADIDPFVRTDGMSVVSVTENAMDGAPVLVARLRNESALDAFVVGKVGERGAVTWLSTQKLGVDRNVAIIGLAATEGVLAEYVEEHGQINIYNLSGSGQLMGAATLSGVFARPHALFKDPADPRILALAEDASKVYLLALETSGSISILHETDREHIDEIVSVCLLTDLKAGSTAYCALTRSNDVAADGISVIALSPTEGFIPRHMLEMGDVKVVPTGRFQTKA